MSLHLGVMVGLASEAGLVRKSVPKDLSVSIGITGARVDRTKDAARHLVDHGATHLLSFGFAGGLDPALQPGALLMPQSVLTTDGAAYSADENWFSRVAEMLEGMPATTAPMLGVDEVIAGPTDKARLFQRYQAGAVDMESHILAAAAATRHLPLLVIRAVIDTADRAIPAAATVSVSERGGLNLMALLGSLLAAPGQLPELIALGRASSAAKQSLLRCCRRCGPLGFGMR